MKLGLSKLARRCLLVSALSLLLGGLGFYSLPWWLVAPAETVPAEVILHFAIGDRSVSDEYVADLYQRGLTQQIVCLSTPVAWQVYPADYARQHLIALGVPAERVRTYYLPITDCRAETLTAVAAFVKRQGWRSALLVVEPAGSRRHKRVATRLFAREQIAVGVTYAPRDKEVLLERWWREHWKLQRLIGEAIDAVIDLFYTKCR